MAFGSAITTGKELKQTGKRISAAADFARDALPSGKRVSMRGNVYWETRKNRTDKIGERL